MKINDKTKFVILCGCLLAVGLWLSVLKDDSDNQITQSPHDVATALAATITHNGKEVEYPLTESITIIPDDVELADDFEIDSMKRYVGRGCRGSKQMLSGFLEKGYVTEDDYVTLIRACMYLRDAEVRANHAQSISEVRDFLEQAD